MTDDHPTRVTGLDGTGSAEAQTTLADTDHPPGALESRRTPARCGLRGHRCGQHRIVPLDGDDLHDRTAVGLGRAGAAVM
jgi:hypothetical protein